MTSSTAVTTSVQGPKLRAMTSATRGLFDAVRSTFGRVGFSRHGVLAASRRLYPHSARTPARRFISLGIGSSLIGVGVALLVQANLGLSPYDVLVSGLQPRLGISFGQTVWAVSAVLFAAAALLGEFPSRWGLAYVAANGLAIDAASGLINAPDSMVGRVLFVFASLISISAGISLVVHSGSTGGAFELLMRAAEKRGLRRSATRTGLEVGVLSLGIALGGSFGFATVAIAMLIGPTLVVMGQALADHSAGREARVRSQDKISSSAAAADRDLADSLA